MWVASPNISSRNGADTTHIVIHTAQGSYSGTINWLANSASKVSAHYVVRSSDGQITQMVRHEKKAWHARSANPYSIGIEHEGFVDNPDWYTEELYLSSSKLSKYICSAHNIDCAQSYAGVAHQDVIELSQQFVVKGHQHYPDQSHTDPGINWNWPYYFQLLTDFQLPVPNQPPVVKFTKVCDELNCEFDAYESTDEGSISQYDWNLGDGNTATGNKLSHSYAKSGTYSVTLTLTDNEGLSAEATQTVKVVKKVASPENKKSSGGGGGSIFGLLIFACAVFIRRNIK